MNSKEKKQSAQEKPPELQNGRRRAVFFDRDGTLNKEIGYLNHSSLLELYPFAGKAVGLANRANLLTIVVTTQAGVAQGLFEEPALEKIHRQFSDRIQAAGGKLDGIFYCPHHPRAIVETYRLECDCRKPGAGMLERAATRFGIDLEKSFIVGDRYVDIQAGHRVGARSVLVLTGFGKQEWEAGQAQEQRQPDYVAKNVHQAVRWILQQL
ncbi:MAG: HAD family hydrolase [Acidobacteria bacterium]|nr:HAD family hydrolase [Acidobacteriota bacterium]